MPLHRALGVLDTADEDKFVRGPASVEFRERLDGIARSLKDSLAIYSAAQITWRWADG
jgi:hypothetical protein